MAAPVCTTPNTASQEIPVSSGTGVAPTCVGSAAENINSGTGISLPSIPLATDLPSALAAINALAMGFRIMTRQIKPAPKQQVPGHGQTSSLKTKDGGASKQGRWNEERRGTKIVRVTNPDDSSQFVDVEQITDLVMKDSKTNEQWKWKR